MKHVNQNTFKIFALFGKNHLRLLLGIPILQLAVTMDLAAQQFTASYYSNTANVNGNYNAAFGNLALDVTTGGYNTAIGYKALNANTIGYSNTAVGYRALNSNTTGINNTATGYVALYSNTSGDNNTANGYQALYSNTDGTGNTASGSQALRTNSTGDNNTAIGHRALYDNTNGVNNTAIGTSALENNTQGDYNTAVGAAAGDFNSTGNYNTILGYDAHVNPGTLSHSTAIGEGAIANANYKVRLGSSSITSIQGQVAYMVESDGRFKTNISETDVIGLPFIMKLRPVVYNFDTRKFQEFLTQSMPEETRNRLLDRDFAPSTAIRHSGFIAQEVEKSAAEVGYNFSGMQAPESSSDNYALGYGVFVVPLVKAVQEQQKQIDELRALAAALLATPPTTTSSSTTEGNSEANVDAAPTSNQISIYSNPNRGQFTINTNTIDEGTLEITNLLGISVLNIQLKENTFDYAIDLSNAQKGEYIVRIISGNTTISKRLVIE